MITTPQNRRHFLKMSLGLTLGSGAGFFSATTHAKPKFEMDLQTKEPIKPEMVREYVTKAHGDIARVKDLLEQEPQLLNAAWDWGAGDYETAVGAAGHVGRVDIAEFLIAKGARIDIFVAAMLGKIEVVKATLTAYPILKSSKGPHGLTLLHHARQGGENAKEVLQYLTELGAS